MISNTGLLLGWGAPETAVRVGFPTPSTPLSTGAPLQEFRAQVRRVGTDGSIPDAQIDLFESGGSTPLASLPVSAVNTTDPGEVLAFAWDAAVLSQVSGANVEARLYANPRGGSYTEVGAIEWNASLQSVISSGFLSSTAEEYGATVSKSAENTAVEVSFEDLTLRLDTGANAQEFRVLVRKAGAGAGDPTVTLGVYEGGVLRATPVSNLTVSSTSGAVVSGTWDASVLTNRTTNAVTLRISGTGQPGAVLEVGAVEWIAQPSDEKLILAPLLGDDPLYGARLYGDPVTITSGFYADAQQAQVFGSTVRGGVLQASSVGALVAGPYVPGAYPPRGVASDHEVFGATLTQTQATGGRERVKPNQILAIAGLSGVVGDIDDDPDEPDQTFLNVS